MVIFPSRRAARKLAVGIVCCAIGACTSSNNPNSGAGGTGGGEAGTAGVPASTGAAGKGDGGGTGGAVTGAGGSGGSTSTGGTSGTGGAPTGVGGSTGAGGTLAGSGGATAGAGGTVTGTGGAGPGGASGAAGASSSACDASAVLCDGFERAMVGPDWTVDNSVAANVVEIVHDKGHNSMSSVHMKFGTAATATFIDETKGFPATDYWGRVWLFVMTGLEAGHHVYIEGSTGMNPSNTGIRALNTQGGGKIATNNAPPDSGGTSNVSMPQGTWTCFEWHIAATGGKENVNLYMNGTEVPGTAASTTPAVTESDQAAHRVRALLGGMAGELWIDDYATGPTRQTCGGM